MTGQLPLVVAALLIKCTPTLGATSDDDATAVTPVLHPLVFGNQQDPILILGHIARGASHAFPVSVLLSPPPTQLLERALEVLSEGHLVGGPSCICPSQQMGFRGVRSGSCARAWEGGGGRAARKTTLSSSVVQVDVIELIWRRPT